MSPLEKYLLVSLFFVFLFVFYRWLKKYLQRNEIQEAFPFVFPFEGKVFNGRETLRFELPQQSEVRIEILDESDALISEEYSGELERGTHIHGFDCTVLDPGNYQLRITFSNQVITRPFSVDRSVG